MIGCSVKSKSNYRHIGILAGHAYYILDVFEISKPRGRKRKKSKLLRIKNPLGRKDWIGKWSDDNVETKKNKELIKNELNEKYKVTHEKINLSQEDGTFHMYSNDFRKLSNKLFICKNLCQIY